MTQQSLVPLSAAITHENSVVRLQRKCACEESGTTCARCASERKPFQRKATGSGSLGAVPPIVNKVLESRGEPLDGPTQSFMEVRFGHDFSNVRVHSDYMAAASARAVNARAYTVGSDIVFATGQYSSATRSGRELLAHELTHVVQQTGWTGASTANLTMEREADAVAGDVARGRVVPRIAAAQPIALARKPGGEPLPPAEPISREEHGRLTIGFGEAMDLVTAWYRSDRATAPKTLPPQRTRLSRKVEVAGVNRVEYSVNEKERTKLEQRGYRVSIQPKVLDKQFSVTVAWGNPADDVADVPEPEKRTDEAPNKPQGSRYDYSPAGLPHYATADPSDLTGSMLDDALGAIEYKLEHAKAETPETAALREKQEQLKQEQQRRHGSAGAFGKLARTAAQAALAKGAAGDPKEMAAAAAISFTIGFVEGAQYEIRPKDWREIGDEIKANPLTFQMGAAAGSVEGALEGIWDAVKGLLDLLQLGIQLSPAGLAARGVKELSEYLMDPEGYRKRMGENQAKITAVASAFKEFIEKVAKDPGFLSAAGEDLGKLVGRQAGDWFSTTFKDKTTFEKGRTVGGVWGRIAIEIAMLFLGPEEWAARGATAAGEAARASSTVRRAILDLIEHIPALKKLYEARQLAKSARAEQKAAGAARSAEKTEGLAQGAVRAEEKAAPAAGTAEKVLAQKALKDGHTLKFTPEGCKVCSAPPCPLIRKQFAKELDENPRLAERLTHAKGLSASLDPKQKAQAETIAEEVYEDLKRIAQEGINTDKRKVPTYLRDLDRLQKESKQAESARRELAAAVEQRMPAGTKVRVVRTERSEAGIAQGRAATRKGAPVDPDIEYEIDLPDQLRSAAGLTVPEKGAARAKGTFKPDDIRFLGEKGDKYLFMDHKEVQTVWEKSYYASEKARPQLRAMLERHLDIARAMQPNCRGFAYTTNEPKLANLLAEEIAAIRKSVPAAKDLLHAPGFGP
ncbi:MAG: eCIS core domain-containing protein [Methylococcales bacterium]